MAHVLAMAVQALYPGTQVTIGPAIDDGFYYDFARAEPFTPDDLPKIEEEMRKIIKAGLPPAARCGRVDQAIEHFRGIGETYKAELIGSIPAGEDVSIYWHGDWHDLCRGPHFATTAQIGDAFKLTKISGAYWRGDAKNAQLQRIYGTAQRGQEGTGRLSDAAGGSRKARPPQDRQGDGPVPHPGGRYRADLLACQRLYAVPARWKTTSAAKRVRADYIAEVKTPQQSDRKLWEASTAIEKNYREHMFIAEVEDENRTLQWSKPMNCPAHVQIFNEGLKSYHRSH